MEPSSLDWAALERLRAGFLDAGGAGTRRDYWDGPRTLASYDATFAERIGWKWDAVLAHVGALGWKTPAPGVATLLDWGCGTGVASRRVVEAFGPAAFARVRLHDRSRAALDYAAARLSALAPTLELERARDDAPPPTPYVLVVSHVLGELDTRAEERLVRVARSADAVLWVEPGATDVARRLVAARELLRRSGLHAIAPCTHDAACGLTAADRSRDWCHFFAPPPPHVFTDGTWAEFSRRLHIDLRALPVSYLVMCRRTTPLAAAEARRVLGRPRCFKGYCTYASCGSDGVRDARVLRREDAAFCDRLEEGGFAMEDRVP